MIGLFVGTIVWSLIWGFATNAIIHNKGYDTNWFWWGFFFGLIAFIIACARPQNYYSYSYGINGGSSFSNISVDSITKTVDNTKLLDSGGWTCLCGKTHASYVTSCSCGRSIHDQNPASSSNTVITSSSEQKNLKTTETTSQPEKKESSHLTKSTEPSAVEKNHISEVDQFKMIKQYKELLDAGIITEEEFNTKKHQLLDL